MIRCLINRQSIIRIIQVTAINSSSLTRTMATDRKPKVFVTRRVPTSGITLLKERCEVSQWDREEQIPRDELLRGVQGVDALFCLLTDKIDKEVLDKAGLYLKICKT